MPPRSKTEQLTAVYSAKSTAEIARAYDGWAATYDSDMAKAGYFHPSVCLALLARHLPRGAAPLLDAGAGTGLIGEWLGLIGYPHVEALDISEGMLAAAAAKNIYAALHCAALGEPLPFANGQFAGIISTGVFTTGHVGAEALDELVRATKAGGVIVATVKEGVWQNGFAAKIGALSLSGAVSILEQTAQYVSMPGEPGTTPSLALAFRVS